MSPDQQQPQHVPEPLPEVPQIYTAPPAHVAETPAIEPATIPSPQAPVTVVEVQTATEPVKVTTMAPVAPEAVVEPAVAQPIETPEQLIPIEPAPETPPVEVQPVQPSTLPIQNDSTPPLEQIDLSEPLTPLPSVAPIPPTPPKKKHGLLIGLIAGGILLLSGVAVLLYIFVFNAGKLSESDLVSSTTDSTSYLRPKQWQSIATSEAAGYGNKTGKDGTSTAAILIKKSSYVSSGIRKASITEIEKFRTSVLNSMTLTSGGESAKQVGLCNSVSDVTVRKSTVITTNLVGVIRIDATCLRDDDTYKVAVYSTLGNDGYARSIALMSTKSLWQKNEAIFNKMLDSADQD